jgi:hypothetical protein
MYKKLFSECFFEVIFPHESLHHIIQVDRDWVLFIGVADRFVISRDLTVVQKVVKI